MPTCKDLKAFWDNLTNCLSGSSSFRFIACTVCQKWSIATWDLADCRRLYSLRRSRKTTSSKKVFFQDVGHCPFSADRGHSLRSSS